MALFLYFGIGTRLFRRKVTINRKQQTISSSLHFSMNKRTASYPDLFTRRVSYRGMDFQDVEENYLSEEREIEGSYRKKYVDYLKISNHDPDFVIDLKIYMNYAESVSTDMKSRRLTFSEKQAIIQRINELKKIERPSDKNILNLVKAYRSLSDLYRKEDQLGKASVELKRAITLIRKLKDSKPNLHSDLLSYAGALYMNLGEYKKSKINFQNAYKVFGDPEDLYGTAICQLQLGDPESAMKNLHILYEEWKIPKYLTLISDILIASGRRGEAGELIRNVIDDYGERESYDFSKLTEYAKKLDKYVISISQILKREFRTNNLICKK